MRISPKAFAGVAVATVLMGVSVAGCNSDSTSSGATSGSSASTTASQSSAPTAAPAEPTDYTRLLVRGEDILVPGSFTTSPPIQNPDGKEGVSVTFSNQDRSGAIIDTILILPDPAAAAAALDEAKTKLPESVAGIPVPADIGTGGTTVSGNSPDGSRGMTVLLFTQGRAFVTIKFEGPADSPPPPEFVTDVGQQQAAAIKNGLPG